mmetsp:Transcript_2083/g.5798  ORF Transcript_2083/g.5798 Transcript_2083/m.5798 type:complete len:210 (+) Transcript_2083:242-871(+)
MPFFLRSRGWTSSPRCFGDLAAAGASGGGGVAARGGAATGSRQTPSSSVASVALPLTRASAAASWPRLSCLRGSAPRDNKARQISSRPWYAAAMSAVSPPPSVLTYPASAPCANKASMGANSRLRNASQIARSMRLPKSRRCCAWRCGSATGAGVSTATGLDPSAKATRAPLDARRVAGFLGDRSRRQALGRWPSSSYATRRPATRRLF